MSPVQMRIRRTLCPLENLATGYRDHENDPILEKCYPDKTTTAYNRHSVPVTTDDIDGDEPTLKYRQTWAIYRPVSCPSSINIDTTAATTSQLLLRQHRLNAGRSFQRSGPGRKAGKMRRRRGSTIRETSMQQTYSWTGHGDLSGSMLPFELSFT